MLSEVEFLEIINRPESSILDFKRCMYDFNSDTDLKVTAKFVKDILSLGNTIRNEPAFIIFGIEVLSDFSKNFIGLDNVIDDALLQDKIKDKVYPRPQFHFYTHQYDSKSFGIIEIPIKKHSTPPAPIIKMKGLDLGKIYFRQGTSNSEATGQETIRIFQWLESLIELNKPESWNDQIGKLLKQLAGTNEKLSVIISEIWALSLKYQLSSLSQLCSSELRGLPLGQAYENSTIHKYRILKLFISVLSVQINPSVNVNADRIKKEFQNHKDFHKQDILISQPITQLEEMLDKFDARSDNIVAIITMSSKDMFGDQINEDHPVFAYIFPDELRGLYASIRQKFIDHLIEINITA